MDVIWCYLIFGEAWADCFSTISIFFLLQLIIREMNHVSFEMDGLNKSSYGFKRFKGVNLIY